MEIFIVLLILGGFIGQGLLTRYFFKQLGQRITTLSVISSPQAPPTGFPSKKLPEMPFMQKVATNPAGPVHDTPEKNHVVDEDPNVVDYNESLFIPNGVKVELEGGDSQVPPGFTEGEGKQV
jgi:hypothetical protein